MIDLRTLAVRVLYEAMTVGARFPALALPIARARQHGVALDAETVLVVEGFPRSGNSFAVAAIATAQPEPIRIAHHLHAPAHAIEACNRGIACLLVVRDPAEAVVELVVTKPRLTVAQALRGYRRFHAPLLPLSNGMVVATYEQVSSDMGAVVTRVNERFGTAFDSSGAAVGAVSHAIEEYWEGREGPGLPLLGRTGGADDDAVRARARSSYEDQRLSTSRARAEDLYARFRELAC